jgi:hypothetical protein
MKLSSSFLSKAFAALLVSTAANTVNATAFQVTNTNDSGAGSLRQAITDSNASDSSADTITFGVTGTITLNSGLPAINSSGGALTITGPGETLLTINGNQGDFSIFSVDSGGNLSISGVTVSGAHFTSGYGGGGFYNNGTLSVSNSTISNNFSSGNGGGGFYNDNGGTLSISNSTITKNSTEGAGSGGGAIFSFGTLTINNSNISRNSAPLAGAISSYASLSILGSSLDENIATTHDSGALRTTNGTATISNSSFTNNSALTNGGAFQIAVNATVREPLNNSLR